MDAICLVCESAFGVEGTITTSQQLECPNCQMGILLFDDVEPSAPSRAMFEQLPDDIADDEGAAILSVETEEVSSQDQANEATEPANQLSYTDSAKATAATATLPHPPEDLKRTLPNVETIKPLSPGELLDSIIHTEPDTLEAEPTPSGDQLKSTKDTDENKVAFTTTDITTTLPNVEPFALPIEDVNNVDMILTTLALSETDSETELPEEETEVVLATLPSLLDGPELLLDEDIASKLDDAINNELKSEKPTDNQEPAAEQEPADDQEPAAEQEPADDQEPAAEQEPADDQEPAAEQEPADDPEPEDDQEPAADSKKSDSKPKVSDPTLELLAFQLDSALTSSVLTKEDKSSDTEPKAASKEAAVETDQASHEQEDPGETSMVEPLTMDDLLVDAPEESLSSEDIVASPEQESKESTTQSKFNMSPPTSDNLLPVTASTDLEPEDDEEDDDIELGVPEVASREIIAAATGEYEAFKLSSDIDRNSQTLPFMPSDSVKDFIEREQKSKTSPPPPPTSASSRNSATELPELSGPPNVDFDAFSQEFFSAEIKEPGASQDDDLIALYEQQREESRQILKRLMLFTPIILIVVVGMFWSINLLTSRNKKPAANANTNTAISKRRAPAPRKKLTKLPPVPRAPQKIAAANDGGVAQAPKAQAAALTAQDSAGKQKPASPPSKPSPEELRQKQLEAKKQQLAKAELQKTEKKKQEAAKKKQEAAKLAAAKEKKRAAQKASKQAIKDAYKRRRAERRQRAAKRRAERKRKRQERAKKRAAARAAKKQRAAKRRAERKRKRQERAKKRAARRKKRLQARAKRRAAYKAKRRLALAKRRAARAKRRQLSSKRRALAKARRKKAAKARRKKRRRVAKVTRRAKPKRNPAAARKYYQKGMRAFLGGKLKSAERELGRALRADPKLADAHRVLGMTYMRMQKKKKAKRHLKSFLRLAPGHPIAAMIRNLVKNIK